MLSPSDRASEVSLKIRDWLEHGTQQVWVVDPDTQTVTVHTPDNRSITYTREQAVPGGDVVPGFELDIDELFKASSTDHLG